MRPLKIRQMNQTVQRLRRSTRPIAFKILRAGFIASVLAFCIGMVLTNDARILFMRIFMVFFSLSLTGFVVHFALIATDESLHRHYGTAIWMLLLVVGFIWIIQSCIRGAINGLK